VTRAEVRDAIAAALSEVTGPSGDINGHAHRPTSMNELDAWPQWRGGTYAGGQAVMMQRWDVMVVLPAADDVTADAFADAYGDALVDALASIMAVSDMIPAKIDTEPGDLYALLLSGRRE
jgi:hypothetical protein